MFVPVVNSLFVLNFMEWKNKEIEKELNTGSAKAENVGRVWLARNDHMPAEYAETKSGTVQPNETAWIAPKLAAEEAKPLPKMLAYAGRFQTDDGMTAYLRRNMEKLPETDRGTVADLLQYPAADIRREINRILSA